MVQVVGVTVQYHIATILLIVQPRGLPIPTSNGGSRNRLVVGSGILYSIDTLLAVDGYSRLIFGSTCESASHRRLYPDIR